jgi:hypothetical protein
MVMRKYSLHVLLGFRETLTVESGSKNNNTRANIGNGKIINAWGSTARGKNS